MTTVQRHVVDKDAARHHIERLTKDQGASPTAATQLDQAMKLLEFRTVLDPAAAETETRQALRAAAEAVAASAAKGHPGLWLTGVWLAVADRNDEVIRRLCAVPLDALRDSGVEWDDYMDPWVETLQRFLTRREIGPDLFLAVMDGTDPDTVRFVPPRIMLDLIYPPIKMFYYLLRRDQAKFTAAAVAAVEDHRRFWSVSADDPNGFLALAPLGVAVLARSAGMTVDVESDYLPRNFLLGTTPG